MSENIAHSNGRDYAAHRAWLQTRLREAMTDYERFTDEIESHVAKIQMKQGMADLLAREIGALEDELLRG